MKARMMSLIVIAALTTHCARYPDPSKAAAAKQSSDAGSSTVIGAWQGPCLPVQSDWKLRLTHTRSFVGFYASGLLTTDIVGYTDSTCANEYTQADYDSDSRSGENTTFLKEMLDGVTLYQDYVAGKPDAQGIGTLDLKPEESATIYTIYQVSGNSLLIGQECLQDDIDAGACSTLAGSSPSNRPKTLAKDRVFTRH